MTSLSLFTFMHWRRKWQPTPVFLPGESQGLRSLVGCPLWGRTESDTTEATWQGPHVHHWHHFPRPEEGRDSAETKKEKKRSSSYSHLIISILQESLLLEEYKEASWQECLLNQVCRQQQLFMRGEHRCMGTDLRASREVNSTGCCCCCYCC